MSEEIKDEELEETTEEVETEEVDSSAEDVKTETTEQVETEDVEETEPEEGKAVPYKRFKQVNEKMKSLQAELDGLKNGSIQEELAETTNEVVTDKAETETIDSADDEVSRYKAAFNQIFSSKLEQVPEDMRDLIPEGDDLQKMAWIDAAISKGLFTVEKPQDFGTLGANPTEEEQPNNSAFSRSLGRKF